MEEEEKFFTFLSITPPSPSSI